MPHLQKNAGTIVEIRDPWPNEEKDVRDPELPLHPQYRSAPLTTPEKSLRRDNISEVSSTEHASVTVTVSEARSRSTPDDLDRGAKYLRTWTVTV